MPRRRQARSAWTSEISYQPRIRATFRSEMGRVRTRCRGAHLRMSGAALRQRVGLEDGMLVAHQQGDVPGERAPNPTPCSVASGTCENITLISRSVGSR